MLVSNIVVVGRVYSKAYLRHMQDGFSIFGHVYRGVETSDGISFNTSIRESTVILQTYADGVEETFITTECECKHVAN